MNKRCKISRKILLKFMTKEDVIHGLRENYCLKDCWILLGIKMKRRNSKNQMQVLPRNYYCGREEMI